MRNRPDNLCQQRFHVGVMVFALLFAGSLIVGACGSDESPEANSTPPQGADANTGEGPTSPLTEAGQDSAPEAGEDINHEPEQLMTFEEANGFEIYQRYCNVCHGESGAGDGFNAFNLDPGPRSLVGQFAQDQMSDEEMARSIRLGGAGRNKSPLMPRWGNTLNSRQIRYVISYIRLLQQRIHSTEPAVGN